MNLDQFQLVNAYKLNSLNIGVLPSHFNANGVP